MRLLILTFFICSARLLAYDASIGPAILEEGDDRLKPAAYVSFSAKDFGVHLFYNKNTYSPVHIQNTMIAITRPLPIVLYDQIHIDLGGTALYESVTINYQGEKPSFQKEQGNFNLGLFLSFSATYDLDPFSLRIGWQSGIFPAGLTGGILLASGRKQYISFSLGLKL